MFQPEMQPQMNQVNQTVIVNNIIQGGVGQNNKAVVIEGVEEWYPLTGTQC